MMTTVDKSNKTSVQRILFILIYLLYNRTHGTTKLDQHKNVFNFRQKMVSEAAI